ncbi:MAG: WbuC family cupin fold metalloprotein [Cyanobacteriota bacterium]|jgi:cupin fold WbuC family metalloprotein
MASSAHGPSGPSSAKPAAGEDLPGLRCLDQALFDAVSAEARLSPRLRRNHNLHEEPELVQRFLNVMQPGTYVRPHRHLRDTPGAGFECFVVLQGAMGLLLLTDQGVERQRLRLDAAGPLRGVQLPEGVFHTLVALAPDTVMLEIKQGPYQPASDKDFLAPFPLEGTPGAQAQEWQWRQRFLSAA